MSHWTGICLRTVCAHRTVRRDRSRQNITAASLTPSPGTQESICCLRRNGRTRKRRARMAPELAASPASPASPGGAHKYRTVLTHHRGTVRYGDPPIVQTVACDGLVCSRPGCCSSALSERLVCARYGDPTVIFRCAAANSVNPGMQNKYGSA